MRDAVRVTLLTGHKQPEEGTRRVWISNSAIREHEIREREHVVLECLPSMKRSSAALSMDCVPPKYCWTSEIGLTKNNSFRGTADCINSHDNSNRDPVAKYSMIFFVTKKPVWRVAIWLRQRALHIEKVLDHVWRPYLEDVPFLGVRYSMLLRIADAYTRNKKTYNNAISALRRAFNFGYLDRRPRGRSWSGSRVSLCSARTACRKGVS